MTLEDRMRAASAGTLIHWVGLILVALAAAGVWPGYGPWTVVSVLGAFVFFAWGKSVRRDALNAPWPSEKQAQD